MLHIEYKTEEYSVKNIEFTDLLEISKWLYEDSILVDFERLKNRFYECCFSDSEIFIKVQHKDSIEAIFRGRIEDGTQKELIILCYMVRKDIRGQGLGSFILNKLLEKAESMDVKNIKVLAKGGSSNALEFWDKVGFSFIKEIKNYFCYDENNNEDMIIFQKSIYDKKFN